MVAATSLGARASTIGSDIHLAPGESPHDPRLMAHEAAHTAQQRGTPGGAQAKLAASTHTSCQVVATRAAKDTQGKTNMLRDWHMEWDLLKQVDINSANEI